MTSKCMEIKASIAQQMADSVIEFVQQNRIEKSEAYIDELIANHNRSVWRLLAGTMTRDSFQEDYFNTGQTLHLHLLKNRLMDDQENLAIEVVNAASLAIRLNGQDSKIWLTSEQASVLYSYGRESVEAQNGH